MVNHRICLALFAFVFTVYLLTLCPTIYMGDSGEFAAAAYSMGSSHPPGYILYSIIGKLFTFLPFGNIAFKVNLLSAFFSALSALIVFLIALEILKDRACAVASALFFSFSMQIWQGSVAAEVYSLNLFISSLLILTAVMSIMRDKTDRRLPFFAAFLTGLGMGNHHTVALMAICLLPAFAFRWREYLTPKSILICILFFAIGFLVNLGLVIRSYTDVLFHYSNTPTISAFWGVFTRQSYDASSIDAIETVAALSGAHWFSGIINVTSMFIREYSFFMVFAALGLCWLIYKNVRIPIFFLVVAVVFSTFLYGGENYDPMDRFTVQQFLLPLFVPVSIFIGAGIGLFAVSFRAFLEKKKMKIVVSMVSAVLVLLPVLVLIPKNLSLSDFSGNYYGYQPPRDALALTSQNSLLLNYTDDYIFGVWYVQLVERFREDTVVAGARIKSNKWQFPGSLKGKFKNVYPFVYSDDYKLRDMISSKVFGLRAGFFSTHNGGISDSLRAFITPVHYGHIYLLAPTDAMKEVIFRLPEDYLDRAMERINYERLLSVPFAYRGIATLIHCKNFSSVFGEYARLYRSIGDMEKAEKYYRIAVDFYPDEEIVGELEEMKKNGA